jgi:tetratricopeptide (TPR) repeat protein
MSDEAHLPQMKQPLLPRVVRRIDQAVPWVVCAPILAVLQVWIGGWRGFVIGLAAACIAWLLYRLLFHWAQRAFIDTVWMNPRRERIEEIVETAMATDDWATAVSSFRSLAEEKAEPDYDILIALAGGLMKTGGSDEALPLAEQAVQLARAQPRLDAWRALAMKANILQRLGQPEDALTALQSAPPGSVEASPSTAVIYARILADLGRIDQAEKTLQAAKPMYQWLVRARSVSPIVREYLQREWDEARDHVRQRRAKRIDAPAPVTPPTAPPSSRPE